MKNLAVSTRPSSLSELSGYPDIKATIQNQIDSGRIPSAWLFVGEPGTGKTTLSLILARMIQGKNFQGEPEIKEINGATEGKVDNIRQLLEHVAYQPMAGGLRAIIINEIQRMTDEAQQALLVPVEDSDSPNIWFFTSTDPTKINSALLSRCKAATYRLKGLDKQGVYDLVVKIVEAVNSPSKLFDPIYGAILEANLTAPRDVINAVESYANGLSPQEAVLSPDAEPRYREIASLVVQGNWLKLKPLLKKLNPSDAKPLRSVISGWLRSSLLTSGNFSDIVADTIKGLVLWSAFEAGVDLSGLVAILYTHCKKIGEKK